VREIGKDRKSCGEEEAVVVVGNFCVSGFGRRVVEDSHPVLN
jgi:hypothetical protein